MCLGMGYVSPDVEPGHAKFGKLVPCDCTSVNRAQRLQALSGLTPIEREARLCDIARTGGQTDRMLDAALGFVSNPIGLLTIYGSSGNAKTLTLQAVVNEFLDRQIEAVYVLMKDLVDYVRESIREDASAVQRVSRFQRVRVLAIDEFDKVKATEWVNELETNIIDRRYRDGLAGLSGTVIAMNDSPDRLPPHVASRLKDGRNVLIWNGDADLRGELA